MDKLRSCHRNVTTPLRLNPCVADRARVVGRLVDRLRVDRKEHVVIRKRVPVEVQVDTYLDHRRSFQPTLLTPTLRPDSSRRGKPLSNSPRATRSFSEPDPRHPIRTRGYGLARLGATVSAAPRPGCPPPALVRGLNEKRPLSAARNRDTTRLSCCEVRPTRCTDECDGRVDVGDVCRRPRMVDTAHTGPPPATGTFTVGGSADCGESPVRSCPPGTGRGRFVSA